MANISIDWKFFAMLLAAVAGVVVPLFLWQSDLASRSLSVHLVSSIALQPEASPSVQDLQITLDGVKIESPYLSTLELINGGSKPISAHDFESPLEIRLTQNRQVVRARIASSRPDGISGSLVSNKQAIKLQPLLLNPNDSLTLAIITSGGQPAFKPHARIAGVSKIYYEDSTIKKTGWKRAATLLPVATFSFVLYVLYVAYLIRPHTISRPLAVGTMLVCLIASSLTMQRAYQALEIEVSTFSIFAFAAISTLFALPFYFRQMRRARFTKCVEPGR